MKLPAALTKKLGPLPVYGWAGVVVGAIFIARYVRNRTPAIEGTPTQEAKQGQDAVGLDSFAGESSIPYGVGPPVYSTPYAPEQGAGTSAPGGSINAPPQRVEIIITQGKPLPSKPRILRAPAPKPATPVSPRAVRFKKPVFAKLVPTPPLLAKPTRTPQKKAERLPLPRMVRR